MKIGEIIKNYRIDNKLTMQEFADKTKLSKAYISMIEKGYHPQNNKPITPSITTLSKIASGMNISLNDFLEKLDGKQIVDLKPDIKNIQPITTIKLPMLGEVACGEPIFCNEDRESYVEVGSDIKADFCLRAKGDSMINARICDGDIIFVRQQSMVDNGDIAVVIINDEATLKRVNYDKAIGELRLIAENPNYQTMIFHGEELNQIKILGKAIAFQGDVK